MENNYDVILRFLLDQPSQAKTRQGTKDIASDLDNVDKVVKGLDATFADLEEQMKSASTVKDFDSIERQLKDVEKQVNETTKAYSLQARVLRAEAASVTSDFEKARISQLKNISDRIGRVSTTSLVAGTAILGGAFAEANRFAKEAEDAGKATEATREWTQATKELAQARSRVDTVLLRETLPLLQQAAKVANQAASFVERNPEIVSAALKTGEALAAMGALGIAVSRGIKLYADARTLLLGSQELAAAKLQDLAADKQLAAARLRAAGQDIPVPGGGTSTAAGASALGTVGLFTGGVAISALVSNSVSNNLNKLGVEITKMTKNAGLGANVINILTTALSPLLPMLPGIQSLKAHLPEIAKILSKLGIDLGNAPKPEANSGSSLSVADSSARDQLLKAYEDYKADDLAMVQEHYAKRNGIIQDALQAELDANRKYADSVAKVNANTASSLAKAATDFAQANARAEQQYQDERVKIVQNGEEEIAKIETDSKERLRKLAEDHNDRVADLTARRDALGLAKENRDYKRQVSEEKRQTTQEIRERRQAIAERLADLKQSYEQERAERFTEYQQRVAEIRTNAAEQLKELAAQHQEELTRIREQKIARLRELDSQFTEERKRRYQYFLAQIRDLDASLLGETRMRQLYHQKMLTDLDAFLASYRTKLASLSGTTTGSVGGRQMAFGGYAGYGTYKLGDSPSGGRGGVEYVLTNRTVQAAENIIGGRLTQEGFLAALSGAGRGNQLTIHANQRYDGEYTGAMRRTVRKDMQDVAELVFAQMFG